LFHVTADTRWSDLPLSGAFVDMLKRIVSLAGSMATADPNAPGSGAQGALKWCRRPAFLDGFGGVRPPAAECAGRCRSALPGAEPPRTRPGSMDRRKGLCG
jgi:hypothetical protein